MNTQEIIENRETWAKALESGEYLQGQSRLRTDNADGSYRFCCLGVAVDMFGEGEWFYSGFRFNDPMSNGVELAGGYSIGRQVSNKLDLNWDEAQRLGFLNDNGASFTEIAAEIRAMPVRGHQEVAA